MINKELIVLDSELKTRDEIIKNLAEKALKAGYISNLDEYINAVDIAFIGFFRCKEEIEWAEEQKEKVKLVFLLGVPESKKETLHLKILAQISRKLMDEEFREKLIFNDMEKVFELLNEIEKNILSEN